MSVFHPDMASSSSGDHLTLVAGLSLSGENVGDLVRFASVVEVEGHYGVPLSGVRMLGVVFLGICVGAALFVSLVLKRSSRLFFCQR